MISPSLLVQEWVAEKRCRRKGGVLNVEKMRCWRCGRQGGQRGYDYRDGTLDWIREVT
jgi:hypothetical protein